MATIRVEMNSEGVVEFLKSAEVQADLERRARAVAAAAGPDHAAEVWVGRDRARATIRTTSARAARAEAIDRTLTAALSAAGGA